MIPRLLRKGLAVFHPQSVHGGYRRHVGGLLYRMTQGDRSLVLVSKIPGGIAVEIRGLIQEQGGTGIPAAHKGGQIHQNGFDGGTGGTPDAGGPVKAQLYGIVPSADHGPDASAGGVHHHHGAFHLGSVGGVFGKQLGIFVGFLRCALYYRVHFGIDTVPPG